MSIGTSSAQGTITDNDGLTAAVTALATSVDEGQTAEFAVALTGGTSTPTSWSPTPLAARPPQATTTRPPPTSRSRSAPGSRAGTVSIEILTDRVVENNDETVAVTLTGATTSTGTATVDGDNDTATTAINNTRQKATIIPQPPPGASRTAIASRSASAPPGEWPAYRSTRLYSAGDCYSCANEGDPIKIYLVLADPVDGTPLDLQAGQTVIVDYRTRDITGESTATAGSDYTATDGTLTFARAADGKARASTKRLQTTEDTLNERVEEFEIAFTEATLPDGEKTTPDPVAVTIEDDDPITATLTPSRPVSVNGGAERAVRNLFGEALPAARARSP